MGGASARAGIVHPRSRPSPRAHAQYPKWKPVFTFISASPPRRKCFRDRAWDQKPSIIPGGGSNRHPRADRLSPAAQKRAAQGSRSRGRSEKTIQRPPAAASARRTCSRSTGSGPTSRPPHRTRTRIRQTRRTESTPPVRDIPTARTASPNIRARRHAASARSQSESAFSSPAAASSTEALRASSPAAAASESRVRIETDSKRPARRTVAPRNAGPPARQEARDRDTPSS